MKKSEGTQLTHLAVFTGIWSDVSVLDFSKLNLRFIKFNSPEFTKIIHNTLSNPEHFEDFREQINDDNSNPDSLQVLTPIDFRKVVPENILFKVRNMLRLLFPSRVTLSYLQKYSLEDGDIRLQMQTDYSIKPIVYEDQYYNYLTVYDHEIKSINAFITIFMERFDSINYVKPTLNAYLSSFFQNFHTMEYLDLCIGLESLVKARSELKYRMRRNIAVLLAPNVEFAENIYHNIGKIYNLRSAIVHSGSYEEEKVLEYLPYLRCLISRIITEVISHNIPSLDELNFILTSKGFGDGKTISEGYTLYKLSNKVYSKALLRLLD